MVRNLQICSSIEILIVQLLDRTRELSDRRGSTDSEKDFRKKYQAITHRLVHRKSCVEMYRRQSSNSFSKSTIMFITRVIIINRSAICMVTQLCHSQRGRLMVSVYTYIVPGMGWA